MGLLWSDRLARWNTAAAAELRRHNLDDAGPIGAKQLRPDQHTATEIKRDRRGRLVYGPEVAIEVYRDEIVLPPEVLPLAGVSKFSGWLFQIRGKKEVVDGRVGATVVLAKFPPSKNHLVTGELKRITKDQKRGIERHLKRELKAADLQREPADVRLAKAISRLSYTPFTNNFPAVAAWGLPKESFNLIGAERRDGDDNYVVGMVPMPLQEAIDTLKGDRILERCLERTESGDLFANAKNDRTANQGPVRKQVLQDIVEHRDKILDFAIRVSLGGFVNPVRMEGQRVAKWAALLYYRFAYAAQSRIEDRTNRTSGTLHYLPFLSHRGLTRERADTSSAWSRKIEIDEMLYQALASPEGKAATAVRALLVSAQPKDLKDFLGVIKRLVRSRPTGWVKKLLQEFS